LAGGDDLAVVGNGKADPLAAARKTGGGRSPNVGKTRQVAARFAPINTEAPSMTPGTLRSTFPNITYSN